MPILTICPLNREKDLLFRAWRAAGCLAQQRQYGRLEAWHFPELDILLSTGGTGKPQFALQTQYLLDRMETCEGVICAGSAGALAEGIFFGDVIVASATVEHDRRGRFFPKPPPSFSISAEILARFGSGFEELAQNGGARDASHRAEESFRVHYGLVASGDEDIVEPERRREIREATGALAVAWEGAGGARACAFNHVPYAEIRGITDAAGTLAPVEFEKSLAPAMNNIATLLLQKFSAL